MISAETACRGIEINAKKYLKANQKSFRKTEIVFLIPLSVSPPSLS
jgi:hypothetical protein